MAKSVLTYANDGGGEPQVQTVTSYDDAGTPTKMDYDYDQYGAVTNTREYGYQVSGVFQVRRRTRNVTVGGYMRSLVTETDIYDAQLNTSDADDVLMAKTTYVYDNYSAMGGMEEYRDAQGQLPPNPPGHLSWYDASYTQRGNVTGTTQWYDLANNLSYTKLFKVDVFGNTVKEQLACCNEQTQVATQNTYWATPEQITKGSAGGPQLTLIATYDFNTLAMKTSADPNGLQTSYGYDAEMRPTQTTLPTGAIKTAGYNDGALSVVKSFTYTEGAAQKTVTGTEITDGWGRVIQAIGLDNGQTNISYDAKGRKQSQTLLFVAGGTPGLAMTYQYDVLDRLTITTFPDNSTVQTSYNGNVVTITDQVGTQRQWQTDGLGRLVTAVEEDPTGTLAQTTTYSYDLLNNLVGVNQSGQTRAFKYDALSRKTYERIPERSATINDGTGTMWSTKYTYTDFNVVLTRQDARGAITSYGYDTLNRLTSISYNISGAPGVAATNNVTYTFDNDNNSTTKGLLLSLSLTGFLPTYQETFSYDNYNHLTSRTWTRDGRSYTVAVQSNTADQVMQLTYPSGRVVNASYDNSGRVSLLADTVGSPYINNFSYDVNGTPTNWTLGNGVREGFTYSTDRLQPISHTAGTISPYTNLMNLSYDCQAKPGQLGVNKTAGNVGQLIKISGTINGTTESAEYTYDVLGRLATVSLTSNGSSAQRRFAYDRWGNRTGVWDATSGGNQIQSVVLQQSGGVPTNRLTSVINGGTTLNYTYDAAGNVTNDDVHTYQYDAENRLVSVDNGATASYVYDQQNRRIKKTVGATATHYIWQDSRVLAEHNASNGAQIIDYVYAFGKLIAAGPGTQATNANIKYFLSDRMSERVSLDRFGNVLGRQAHLPFGEDFAESGTQEKHHFTTYERDSESGNDYALNREYAPATGRFLSADPYTPGCSVKDPRGWNRYSYTRNVAINRIDAEGLSDSGPIEGGCPPPGTGGTWPGKCLCQVVPDMCDKGIIRPNPDAHNDRGGVGESCIDCCDAVYLSCKDVLYAELASVSSFGAAWAECYIKCAPLGFSFLACMRQCLTSKLIGNAKKIRKAFDFFFKCMGDGGRNCNSRDRDCWCWWM